MKQQVDLGTKSLRHIIGHELARVTNNKSIIRTFSDFLFASVITSSLPATSKLKDRRPHVHSHDDTQFPKPLYYLLRAIKIH